MAFPPGQNGTDRRADLGAAPQSPCIQVCEIDRQTGLCRGCLRTLDEIAGWIGFSATEKLKVLDDLPRRRGR